MCPPVLAVMVAGYANHCSPVCVLSSCRVMLSKKCTVPSIHYRYSAICARYKPVYLQLCQAPVYFDIQVNLTRYLSQIFIICIYIGFVGGYGTYLCSHTNYIFTNLHIFDDLISVILPMVTNLNINYCS